MPKYSFQALKNAIELYPMPEQYDAYFVFGLLQEYEIPFRFLKAESEAWAEGRLSNQFFMPIFEIEKTPWILTRSDWASPGVFHPEEYDAQIKAFWDKNDSMHDHEVWTSLKEENAAEYGFYKTLSNTLLQRHADFLTWKANFERATDARLEKEALLEILPEHPSSKSTLRL